MYHHPQILQAARRGPAKSPSAPRRAVRLGFRRPMYGGPLPPRVCHVARPLVFDLQFFALFRLFKASTTWAGGLYKAFNQGLLCRSISVCLAIKSAATLLKHRKT